MTHDELQSVLAEHAKWLAGSGGTRADLSYANLSGANLSCSDLRDADLRGANLRGADLSGATGVVTAAKWLLQMERDEFGFIVYRAEFGQYPHPESWKFAPGSILTETVNPDRCTECGCGVSAATLDWVKRNHPDAVIWKCRIRFVDLADLVVPFGTDGKVRCARLELIEKVED